MQKRFAIIFFALLAVLSCVGQKDDPVPEIRLTVNASLLNVTRGDSALFTVYSGEDDVTSGALICNCTDGTVLPGPVFSPERAGEWHFAAEYGGVRSEEVAVSAYEAASGGKDYFRRSLVLEFTGTWCVNCPGMEAALKDVVMARPGRVVPVSVHCLSIDPMTPPCSDELQSRFSINNVCPSVIIDMDGASLVSRSSSDLILSHIDRLLEERGAAGGITLETSFEGGNLRVEAGMKAVREGAYTFAAILVEDGIVAPQTGSTSNHVHNHVLRQWRQSAAATVLEKGETMQETFIIPAEGNQRVVVAILRNGIVDNVADCPAGASVGYLYEF